MTHTAIEFTGSGALTRFIVRRDWLRILIWIGAIALLVVVSAQSVKSLYPTRADLVSAARASEGNAAAIAFNGPAQGLDTLGGQIAFQVGSFGLVMAALMSLFMVGRLTRGEEEAGRLDLLRSLPIGADAPAGSAMTTVAVMNIALGSLVTASLLALNLPSPGSVALGLSFTLMGFFFACVALVAAQLSENTRVVYGIAGTAVAASFVLRALGDIGDGTLSWLTPIGWAQKSRPFAGEVWWPFLLLIVASAGLLITSALLSQRRDLGSGLLAPRAGPAHAARSLGRPVGLAMRLQRGSVVGWSAGVLLTGVAYGSIADSIKDFVKDNQSIADLVAAQGGGTLLESYLAMSMRILALVGAGFAIQSALRLRSEETAMHAEQILASGVSRMRWAASHLVLAFGGTVAVLTVAGLSVGISAAAVTEDRDLLPHSLGAALIYVPAVWVLIGITVALSGHAPRATAVSWAVLAWCFVVAMLGQLLDLPNWVQELSPFQPVPQLPADGFSLPPLLVLTGLAGVLTAIGLIGLNRRDIA